MKRFSAWETLHDAYPIGDRRLCSEAELAQHVLGRLAPHFAVQREVFGTSCGRRRLRVDAVLTPRHAGWKNPNAAFAVEFKRIPREQQSERAFTRWAAQCVDYTHVEWDGYGRLPLLMCPSPLLWIAQRGETTALFLMRLLSSLGVHELTQLPDRGWSLVSQAQHVMWSEVHGVEQGAHWSLTARAGSR